MNFLIELASPNDRDEILNVLRPWNMHRIPSVEAEEIDFKCFFVAKIANKIVGVAGYKLLSEDKGKTRLLAVYPELQGTGIGKALQDARLEAMFAVGVTTVLSYPDRTEIIVWYKKHYGYIEIGKRKKLSDHSLTNVNYTQVLELDLIKYMKNRDKVSQAKEIYISSNDPHPLSPYQPLIINVALTGVIPTKISSPYLPLSVEEIVQDAIKVYDAGASIVHIHARDSDGNAISNARYYEDILSAIRRERANLICCVTTSGRGGSSFEERTEVLHLSGSAKPDMASLTLGSVNFLSGTSVNSFDTVQQLALLMKDKGIKPELEVFDSGMITVAKYLERHNIISGNKYFNILLGNLNTAPATINDLAHLYTSLPQNSIWATAGIGSFQLPMNVASIVAGGHVRVGLEDNIYYDTSTKSLTTNTMLVERIVRISNEVSREVSTPENTRKLLEL